MKKAVIYWFSEAEGGRKKLQQELKRKVRKKARGGNLYILTYDGEQHPYRPEDKGKGKIMCN